MRTRISKVSLIVFVVLLVLSAFLLAVAGHYWPWYATMSLFAVVPLVVGPGRYRLIGAFALVLAGFLIVSDIEAGRRFRAQHPEIRVERLSAQPTEATAQVQRWIPVGTSATEASRVMEKHGFTCSLVTNSAFADLSSIDYVYCDRQEGSIIQQRWLVALVLVEGKVSAVRLTTGLIGP